MAASALVMSSMSGDQLDPMTDVTPTKPASPSNTGRDARDEASTPRGDEGKNGDEESAGIINSRAYQLEMLDESLKQNVIVAMDTGSGKTQVAVLRIKIEIEKCAPGKIIWFLAPTVALCTQQFKVIQQQTPAAKMQLLIGEMNVETWDGSIWKMILQDVNIIVSTYQILLDALNHAFVSMNQLSLLVFDEAHNCAGNNPGQKVMMDHYRPHKRDGKSVPAILGLTATPSIRSNVRDLDRLETTMDAKCVSPTIHREDLLKFVKRPRITHLTYLPPELHSTPTMRSARHVYHGLDIRSDPYILSLRANLTDRNTRRLKESLMKNDTFSQNQMKGLNQRALEVSRQLGPWAADTYLSNIIEEYLRRVDGSDEFFDKWMDDEKKYLADAVRQIDVIRPPDAPQKPEDLSEKAHLLLGVLLSADPSVVGIIFVQERVMVNMLYELLWSIALIREKYRIGTMVGTSNFLSRKKMMYEFSAHSDAKALDKFRSGELNLLIATSVLEEGIDVRACNLVICFDSPSTPKSFIQRRGRARMSDSHLILFCESSGNTIMQWQYLEAEMRKLYEDREREFHRLESIDESESARDTYFVVPSTGARLDFDNAKSHLEHFCRALCPKSDYIDGRPDYIYHHHTEEARPPIISATVRLPSFVPAEVRQAVSSRMWLSEKSASKDAAFQAYLALYKAGFINEHMLPFRLEDSMDVETRARELLVEPQTNPWLTVARAWSEPSDKWLYSVDCVDGSGQPTGSYEVILPVWLNRPRPLRMFLDRSSNWEVRLSDGRPLPHANLELLPDHTSALLALHLNHRWPVEQRAHVIRVFSPTTAVSRDHIGGGKFDPGKEDVIRGRYLIRDAKTNLTPFLYQKLLPFKPPASDVKRIFVEYESAPSDEPYLALTAWPKRLDLLHPVGGDVAKELPSTKPFSRVLPLSWATIDVLPITYVQFGMMIPSLIHRIEVMLVAKELADTLLKPVQISDLDLVREAICAPSAGELVHYERLEFLGDSILKFCSSIHVFAEKPDWPEGYLSLFRDRLVSNSRLSRATMELGLSKFIITKPFTGDKWRPLYLDAYLGQGTVAAVGPDRSVSTKTLADVVEALIGASYVDGGLTKALDCIAVFLNECKWNGIQAGQEVLFNLVPEHDSLPGVLAPLERLIGYTFRKKALLVESVTHASYVGDTGQRSLERLEFLGDAVLDNIIVSRVFAERPALPHYRMHILKTAMVNGDFIAFMTMEHGLSVPETVVVEDPEGGTQVVTREKTMHLWQFMRHQAEAIGVRQQETARRHVAMREGILRVMREGTHYPWDLLAQLQAKKFYSDLFEAVLGAVWIDSGGDMELCRAVVARFGVLEYLERIIRDEVVCVHPKERLGALAGSETVKYDVDTRDTAQGGKEYVCSVAVGGRTVVQVGEGMSREEVKTKAAQAAIEILLAERSCK